MISVSPAAGSVVQRGAHVSVVVSTGPASAGVPDVRGLTSAEAEHKLQQAHFKPNVQNRSSASVASGKVISTEPSQGVPLLMGSPVTVFVSSGPMQVEVPDSGRPERSRSARLAARRGTARGHRHQARRSGPGGRHRALAVALRGQLRAQRRSGEPRGGEGLAGSRGPARGRQKAGTRRRRTDRGGLRGEVRHAHRLKRCRSRAGARSRIPRAAPRPSGEPRSSSPWANSRRRPRRAPRPRRLPAPRPPPPRPRPPPHPPFHDDDAHCRATCGRSLLRARRLAGLRPRRARGPRACRARGSLGGDRARWRVASWRGAAQPLSRARGCSTRTSCSPRCTAPSARTAPCRACWSRWTSPMWAPASRRRRSAWTRCSSKS